jgi:very-short-patch-repair endonuclease
MRTSSIARLAARQHGVISTSQLLQCGLTPAQVATRIRRCELHRLHRGVFAVGHTALPEFGLEHAALLAVGDRAALSHGSAGFIWRITDRSIGPVHVTVLGRTLRSRENLRIHRSDRLTPGDIRTREGLLLTSPACTIIDLAAISTPEEFQAALSEARFRRLIRDGELERALESAADRPGAGIVRAHLAREAGPQITESEAERRFLTLVRNAGLPSPRTQQRIEGYRVDAVWPDRRLIVELDGLTGHGHRSAFERDRRRDAILIAKGWRVIHFTWPQLHGQPLFVIATLSAALAPS